eukprot:INCI5941.18.p1 GENE.INCI5941.18~~INCI5941.18.p1  ORF type:complete len:725 (+),score=101.40 INCI5941.18:47-2176(+)
MPTVPDACANNAATTSAARADDTLGSKSGSKLSMSDAAVDDLVLQRHELRLTGNFSAADAIVRRLLKCNIVVHDSPSAASSASTRTPRGGQPGMDENICTTRWIRVPATFSAPAHAACMFWHHNTRTFCKHERSAGQCYCAKHAASSMCQNRVPCPLDARHGILPARAAHHITRCQSKPGRLGLMSPHWRRCSVVASERYNSQPQASPSKSAAAPEAKLEIRQHGTESGSRCELVNADVAVGASSIQVTGIKEPGGAVFNTSDAATTTNPNPKSDNDWKRVVAMCKNYVFLRSLETKVDAALDFLEARKIRLDSSLLKKRKAQCKTKKGRGTVGGTHGPKEKRQRSEHVCSRMQPQSKSSAKVAVPVVGARNLGVQGAKSEAASSDSKVGACACNEVSTRDQTGSIAANRDHAFASTAQSRANATRKGSHSEQHTAIATEICGLLSAGARPGSQRRLAAFECCAGTGLLSLELCKQLCDNSGSIAGFHNRNFTLIDRSNFQGKADSALRRQEATQHGTKVTRLQADLQDIDFEQLPLVQTMLVATSQGGKCPKAGQLPQQSNDIVFFALCCHHLCEWHGLLDGARALLERFQISSEDFDIMRRLCTCYRAHPVRFGVGGAARSSTSNGRSEAAAAIALCMSTRSGRLAELRAALGIKIKLLVNVARTAAVVDSGLFQSVLLKVYVTDEISPENHLLVATTSTQPVHRVL